MDITRDIAIKRIRDGLKSRSGKAWSVTGGRGTAWGWLRVDAPPARQTWEWYRPEGAPDTPEGWRHERDTGKPGGHTSPADREELAKLLALDGMHYQGVSIPAGHDYWREYIDRAEGRAPAVTGKPYWD